jgi:hypothetical protein
VDHRAQACRSARAVLRRWGDSRVHMDSMNGGRDDQKPLTCPAAYPRFRRIRRKTSHSRSVVGPSCEVPLNV